MGNTYVDRVLVAEATPGSNQYGRILAVFPRTPKGFWDAHILSSQLGKNIDVFCEHPQWCDGEYRVLSLRVGHCGCDSPY